MMHWVFFFLFFLRATVIAADIDVHGGMCSPSAEEAEQCADAVPDIAAPSSHGLREKGSNPSANKTQGLQNSRHTGMNAPRERNTLPQERTVHGPGAPNSSAEGNAFIVHFFWGSGCPHCKEEKRFLDEMKERYPQVKIVDYEVWYDENNAAILTKMAHAYGIKAAGVPITFIGDHAVIGFSEHAKKELSEFFAKCSRGACIDPADRMIAKAPAVTAPYHTGTQSEGEGLECTEKRNTVYVPWIGNLDASQISLPVMTMVIAGLDSFNPCAFFVLFSLLGLLIHAQSRKKMFLIGSVFVFFSGFIYFLFMAAWLNLFLVMGQVHFITKIAGFVAVVIAAINIKDYFLFKKGVSLTIPDHAKPKLFDRMRRLLKSTSAISILTGTVILAIAANAYELLCTAGFPMVFTRILTLKDLSLGWYYLFLILYNVIYVIPLTVIVVIFTITLGKRQLTERQGRFMKLLSGLMMLALGGILLVNPSALSNVFISFGLLAGAIMVSCVIALLSSKRIAAQPERCEGKRTKI